MKKFVLAVLGAAMFLVPSAANAVTLSLIGDGYTNHTLNQSGGFDLDDNPAYGYVALAGGVGDGSDVRVLLADVKDGTNGLAVSGPASVTYTYLGKEAGYTNSLKFSAPGASVFDSNTTGVGATSGTFGILGGLLEFLFTSNSDTDRVFNNALATPGMNIAYFILEGAQSALVFLDDFGAGPDSDFDDIAIRIDIAAVPVPAALPLLGAGLGLLGFVGWRKKRGMGANAAA